MIAEAGRLGHTATDAIREMRVTTTKCELSRILSNRRRPSQDGMSGMMADHDVASG